MTDSEIFREATLEAQRHIVTTPFGTVSVTFTMHDNRIVGVEHTRSQKQRTQPSGPSEGGRDVGRR
jgi:hypothetical protein